MKTFGLTGGVGMGKSTAMELVRNRGIPVIDTDVLAHQLVEPGQPALDEIRAAFGPDYLGAGGGLDREKMAALVFSRPAARARLEGILHPRIAALWHRQIEQWRSEALPRAVVVIPLLFETGAERDCNAVICVGCSAAAQRQRLATRGWTPDDMARRIAAQMPIEQKIARSDYVVWNDGILEVLQEQMSRILR
jgi:dephospho-CoA kinase